MQPLSNSSNLKTVIDILSGIFVAVFSAIALYIIVANPPGPMGFPRPLYFRILEADMPLCGFGLVWLTAYGISRSDFVKKFPILQRPIAHPTLSFTAGKNNR